MAENSAIEWTDHTFNPWEGCQKVGPGCDNCYAEARNVRFAPKGSTAPPNWGPNAPRRLTSKSNWQKPLRWQADAAAFFAAHGRRQRVFCASLADVFDNAVPDQWRSALYDLIHRTPDLDWLLLTKRIGNVAKLTDVEWGTEDWPPNVWLGATIVSQVEADRDIPKLIDTRGPRIRFLSMEPLLGPVDLRYLQIKHPTYHCGTRACLDALVGELFDLGQTSIGRTGAKVDWVIVGGESGPGARPMHPDWARELRDQCAAAGVPLLFKQWGEWVPLAQDSGGEWPVDQGGFCRLSPDGDRVAGGWPMQRVGKKAAGRLLDGVQHDGVPT